MTCNLLISIPETSNETLPLDQDHNYDTIKCYKTFEKLFRMGLGEDILWWFFVKFIVQWRHELFGITFKVIKTNIAFKTKT
jgi:hypothetical protein